MDKKNCNWFPKGRRFRHLSNRGWSRAEGRQLIDVSSTGWRPPSALFGSRSLSSRSGIRVTQTSFQIYFRIRHLHFSPPQSILSTVKKRQNFFIPHTNWFDVPGKLGKINFFFLLIPFDWPKNIIETDHFEETRKLPAFRKSINKKWISMNIQSWSMDPKGIAKIWRFWHCLHLFRFPNSIYRIFKESDSCEAFGVSEW